MSHSTDERVQFQVERIAFFSDAVIAIAITLLVLEIKIPPMGAHTTWKDLSGHIDAHAIASLLGMFVCFWSIGHLWMLHHELFRYVHDYNRRLIRANLLFLLTVTLLPLSTSLLFEENNPQFLTVPLFFLNLGCCHLAYFGMIRVILHRRNKFANVSGSHRQFMQWESLAPASIFIGTALTGLFGQTSYLFLFGGLVLYSVLTRIARRRAKRKMKTPEMQS